jgi:MtrB/PioB family decaheme-associated outer membrane protein
LKKLIALVALVSATPAHAQTPAPTTQPAQQPASGFALFGSITAGVQGADNSTNSSKLAEYRDLDDQAFLPRVTFSAADRGSKWFLDTSGTNLAREDQTILTEFARPGSWNVRADWLGVPHNFSNKALSPYTQSSSGLFAAPATVPITFKKLATAAADTANVLASDDLIATYQDAYLVSTPLSTETNAGHFSGSWSGDLLALSVAYDRRTQTGSKSTFGPIGDRPPRTLNIQLAEPVDYRTNDVTFAADHQGATYQVRAEYLFSDFANQIDTLQWQNIYANGAPSATYDAWDRSVSVYGRRPLAPDNRYHNFTASFGRDLPRDSRFTATAAYGTLEQNEALLPYSYNVDQLAQQTLPRSTAEAQINTTNFTADYVISPARRLNVRAFFRRYDLDNETPSSQWQYVTSDTSNLNGTVSYVNKRVSVPYAFDRQNAGVEATWRLPARSSLVFEYEHESVERNHREADTAEDILRATWRTRAARWVNLDVRYLQGMRDGSEYRNEVTHEGYWYLPSEASDNNNPALTFDNHPDMRRFDVIDRDRRQLDVRVNLTPRDVVAVSAFVRYRSDDFDSDVAPTLPLLGTGLTEQAATSPGDQLGHLEDTRTRYGVDVFVQPNPRVSLNAFLNYDNGTGLDRSLEFNENNKANPSAVNTAELGPWTRGSNQWTADYEDRTWSGGLGATLQVVPDRLTLVADYTASLANFDLEYAGFGVTNYNGTPFPPNHQFAFSSPPTVGEDLHVVGLRAEIPISALVLVVGYAFEDYTLEDWQQGAEGTWVEIVGAETLLRDTSRSFQWGNRLFNLGTYLAPSYRAHLGFVGLRYRF